MGSETGIILTKKTHGPRSHSATIVSIQRNQQSFDQPPHPIRYAMQLVCTRVNKCSARGLVCDIWKEERRTLTGAGGVHDQNGGVGESGGAELCATEQRCTVTARARTDFVIE